MFSGRLPAHAAPNALSRRLSALRASGESWVDLTESNPTRAGFEYPADLLTPLGSARGLRYDPHPLGLAAAREAVARDHLRRGARVDPARVVLTSSTSEAYSWLFKLLCNPGDQVLVPRPSYPLFEHLTRLEAVEAVAYDLEYHGSWHVDPDVLAARVTAHTRAIMLVSPNNPTGSFIKASELEAISRICLDRGLALVADEVFADYPIDAAPGAATDVAASSPVLSFTLGGLSKAVGLPQLKLSWIVVGGGGPPVADALGALELIADSYLSVSTPVQVALRDLLSRGGPIRAVILERVRRNLAELRAIAARSPAATVLACEGGWYAVVRVPSIRSEEELTLQLLDRERVLVHPGYFFDFPHEAFLIVSLLPRAEIFADAAARMLQLATASV